MIRENLVGHVIAGYELQRELGHGAMGIVYKALEKNLHRTVALKILSPKLARKEAEVQGFYKEARAAAKINHPNVVTIFTVGSEGDRHFIAMEYVQGRTLSRTIARKGHLRVEEALTIAKQVAEALESAHRQKIIHRDIKPQNIMIDDEGRARVMDFGIARMKEVAAAEGDEAEWIGTPAYLSPEQCVGEPTDHRADIYALGVTLFEMLAGRTPYTLQDRVLLKKMIVESPIPSIRRFNKDVPYSVVKILERALAKDPKQRYNSCFEMKEDLERALANLDTSGAGYADTATDNSSVTGAGYRTPPAPQGAMPARPARANGSGDAPKPQPVILGDQQERWGGGGSRGPSRFNPRFKIGAIIALALLPLAAAGLFFKRSRSAELAQFVGHRGDVFSIALSPDGSAFVSGAADKTARVWDLSSVGGLMGSFLVPHERARLVFPKHNGDVNCVAFSPDGKRCLSAGEDRIARVWDAASGEEIFELEGHKDFVWSAAVSPDGASALTAGADFQVILWNLESGKEAGRLRGHTSTIKSVAFSPDGHLAVSGGADNTIRVWDIASRSQTLKIAAAEEPVSSVCFSPTGNRILSASWDQSVKLWDASSGKLIRAFKGHTDDVACARFSPDGQRIVSGGWDGEVKVWSVDEAKEIARFSQPKIDVTGALFLPDGSRILSAYSDGTIRLWALPSKPTPTPAPPKESKKAGG